jgi:hypothetical protein
MKPLPLLCVALAMGSVGGWFTAEAHRPAMPSADVPPPSPRVSARQQRIREKAGVPAEVAARLAPIYAATTAAERLKATILLAQTLPVSELELWYERRWFEFKDGADSNVFYEITRERWLAEDPEGMMEVGLRKNWEVLHRMAGRWARTDPDRAIAYLEAQKDPTAGNRLRSSMIHSLAEQRPDWVLAEIGRPDNNRIHWPSAMLMLAEQHPDKLAAAAVDWPAERRSQAEVALTTSRLKSDFNGEFGRLLGKADGAVLLAQALNENYELSKQFSAGILSQIHRLPPEWLETLSQNHWNLTREDPERWLALNYEALGGNEKAADRFRMSALSQMASKQPDKVLEYLARNGLTEGNSSILPNALRSLEKSAPGSAAAWLDRLAGGPEQAELRAILEVEMNPQPRGPATASALLDSLAALKSSPNSFWNFSNSLGQSSPAVQQEVIQSLNRMDPAERLEIARAVLPQGDSQLPLALRAVLVDAALSAPPAAEEEPGRNSRLSPSNAAANLGVAWVIEDPAAATRWAAQLPSGEARQWTLRNMAANWARHDVQAATGWVGSLPPADRQDVREYLEKQKK